ncbi:hypothetical protein VC83_07952 [Pseudogymnoascus destructans]|uniref:Fibroin-3 related protein n=2 Tax=Pseudogymnoascus destructans TaxID=655981 RepID=L8GDV9_PSED2|nr:uncharacterized protein VC83_07952 [Pseudogymnoascus destructans]ELR10321.1 hypothetical protein GMDG_04703 [Pseudogymnoascus destructans 20631-21]OAF56005.1 hypothetical protein VC83_07952 [Pseudogymnoascus destructans]
MPTIDVAMARSVPQEMLLGLQRRDLQASANNVKTSFSSWDNCMKATYCKWPIIAAIIVGGLILLSVVWCIVRCCCCGMSCCCSCFNCLKCCGDCCGCCNSPDKKHKHLDEPYFPPAFAPHGGYKAPDPMMSGGGAAGTPFSPAPAYARFETGPNGMAIDPPKPVNDDALPPMPSWDSAAKRRISIEDEPSAVELGELDPVTGQRMPVMTGAAGAGAISRSDSSAIATASGGASPYGHPNGGGYMSPGPNGRPNDQFSRNNSNGGYGGDQGLSPIGPPGQAYGGRGYFPQNQNQFIGQAHGGPDEQYGNHAIGNAYSDDRRSPYPGDDRGPQGGGFDVMPAPGFGQHQRNDSGHSGQRPFTADRTHVPAGPLSGGGYSCSDESYANAPILSNTSGYMPRGGSPPQGGYRGAPPARVDPAGGFSGGMRMPMPMPQRVDSPQGGFRGPPQGFGGPPPQRMGSPGPGRGGFGQGPERRGSPGPGPGGFGQGPERRGSPGPGQGGFGPPLRTGTGGMGSPAPPSYASRSPGGGNGGGGGGGGGYGGDRW